MNDYYTPPRRSERLRAVEPERIPFPVEQKNALTIADTRFLTVIAAGAIQTLAETGRTSMVIWQGESPELPHKTDTWDLSKVELEDELSLPIETQRRINILRNNGVPIKQVLIAHEHPSRKQMLLETTRKAERRKKVREAVTGVMRALAWATGVLGATLAVLAAVVAVLPLILPALGAIGLCVLLAVGVINGWDPAVVVVLDDGEDSWLLVSYWYETSE